VECRGQVGETQNLLAFVAFPFYRKQLKNAGFDIELGTAQTSMSDLAICRHLPTENAERRSNDTANSTKNKRI
jgi:hypothetical protein